MAGPYRDRIMGVAVKLETTSGVDSVPTIATDGIVTVGIPIIEYDFMESGDRDDEQTGIMSGPDRAPPAGGYFRLPIRIALKGAGAVYSGSVKPPADALWQMSGFGVTTDFSASAEKYIYATLDDLFKTASVYSWSAHRVFKGVGCVAIPRLSAEVYKRGFADFTLQGKLASILDQALPGSPPLGTIPPLFHSAAASLGAWTSATAEPFSLLAANVDFGTEIADYSGAGATDGLIAWLVTNRRVTEEITYYAPQITTADPHVFAAQSGSFAQILAWQLGNVQYNRIQVQARWSAQPPREGTRNGLKTYTQNGVCRVGSGLTSNREIQIQYY